LKEYNLSENANLEKERLLNDIQKRLDELDFGAGNWELGTFATINLFQSA